MFFGDMQLGSLLSKFVARANGKFIIKLHGTNYRLQCTSKHRLFSQRKQTAKPKKSLCKKSNIYTIQIYLNDLNNAHTKPKAQPHAMKEKPPRSTKKSTSTFVCTLIRLLSPLKHYGCVTTHTQTAFKYSFQYFYHVARVEWENSISVNKQNK